MEYAATHPLLILIVCARECVRERERDCGSYMNTNTSINEPQIQYTAFNQYLIHDICSNFMGKLVLNEYSYH